MKIASLPLDEKLRLQDLHSFEILDSETEKEFDDLVGLVAGLYGCPIAAISFMDANRQWFKSSMGLGMCEAPREISFCSHTLLQEGIFIIKDTLEDERFFDNPIVTEDPRIRFYAGASILSSSGYKLGTVCILDHRPRKLADKEAQTLKIVATQVSKLLELRLKNKLLRRSAEHLLQVEKKLVQQALQEQEKERMMIGRELHENIAQGLAATKLYLEMAESGSDPQLIRKGIENVSRMLNQVRDLSKSIIPSTLESSGLNDLLDSLIGRFSNSSGIHATLSYKGRSRVHPDIGITVYRIMEEQLNNIRRHAQATEVQVIVKVDNEIRVHIHDNGIGFDLQQFQKGFGLGKIVSLAEYFGGSVNITAHINGGCNLDIQIPSMAIRS